MATITLGGTPAKTNGELPKVGQLAPDFSLIKTDLTTATLANYKGRKVVLNIFPSIETSVCATSVRQFNEESSKLANTSVLCISRDLPFTQARFCAAEGLTNVECLSDFKDGAFGKKYGVYIESGNFSYLNARAVVVLDEKGKVVYKELVPEIGQEPNYKAAINSL
ncbi:MAG: thiol peroxidase [Bacteroidetes bacterium HGW-Bacteroidetes-2]|jgi:thiol peroxidase|nr:MAG: thiol peroxidase [Bacteroidetes bacterium HGW-Bacteroidetes-2]